MEDIFEDTVEQKNKKFIIINHMYAGEGPTYDLRHDKWKKAWTVKYLELIH